MQDINFLRDLVSLREFGAAFDVGEKKGHGAGGIFHTRTLFQNIRRMNILHYMAESIK